ncbi:xanthine dehydrogenase family protein subunit M [bacterium]|nr:MAG: xanthine dehydrogenase family protein subunit M [bacterium]
MIPASFDYVTADSVEQAIALLQQHGEEAKLLAGGHSLLPMMKLRLARPNVLIDLRNVAGLQGIKKTARGLEIGALTTHAALAGSADVAAYAPLLAEAAAAVGDVQVRHCGTLGGSAAHADAASDEPAALLALEAQLEIVGASGTRTVAAREFFVDMFTTALGPSDVLAAVILPRAFPASAYAKLPHPASHYPVVGAACALTVSGGAIESARIAITGVGSVPFRAAHVEASLAGIPVHDHKKVESLCAETARGVEARSDAYASAEYRVAMADVIAARALLAAAERAR